MKLARMPLALGLHVPLGLPRLAGVASGRDGSIGGRSFHLRSRPSGRRMISSGTSTARGLRGRRSRRIARPTDRFFALRDASESNLRTIIEEAAADPRRPPALISARSAIFTDRTWTKAAPTSSGSRPFREISLVSTASPTRSRSSASSPNLQHEGATRGSLVPWSQTTPRSPTSTSFI